jgi:hypothetical protein
MFTPLLVAGGLAFFFYPPLFAAWALFHRPQLAKVAGPVLALWQQVVLGVPGIFLLTALADLPLVASELRSTGFLLMWLLLAAGYGMASIWMFFQYRLECKLRPKVRVE